MTRKIYRTAQGKMIDLGALQLRNENVRAVGNMSVNARGDLIDADNRPIDTKNKQVSRQYRKQTSNVTDQHVVSSGSTNYENKKSKLVQKKSKTTAKSSIPTPPEDFDDDFDKPETTEDDKSFEGGLAAAIARAREVRQKAIEASTNNSINKI